MQANITRSTILDLVPLYLAGEASDDTKSLVDEFAMYDPQIAKILAAGDSMDELNHTIKVPDMEMTTLNHTRRRLMRKSWQIGLAIFLTAACIMFGWFATFAAAAFWIFYYFKRDKLQKILFNTHSF